jgi:hypothetical protein
VIKLSASIMKKVPMEKVEYSSRSCSAGMEVELPSDAALEEIHARLTSRWKSISSHVRKRSSLLRKPV